MTNPSEKPVEVVNEPVELVLISAQTHGEESEPDHEVGDLQDALRLMWKHLPPQQRDAFWLDIRSNTEMLYWLPTRYHSQSY
jgi:hypothetical protein